MKQGSAAVPGAPVARLLPDVSAWLSPMKNELPFCPQPLCRALLRRACGEAHAPKLDGRVVQVTVLSTVVAPALVNAAQEGSAPLPAVPARLAIRSLVPSLLWMTWP